MKSFYVKNFLEWRQVAKSLIFAKTPPNQVNWLQKNETSLFQNEPFFKNSAQTMTVPKSFVPLAKLVSFHRDPKKWSHLYRTLWRLTYEEKNLLKIYSDSDVILLKKMSKEVKRDAHKMKAFVRFRAIEDPQKQDNIYVAWHEPSHLIVRLTAPFFTRRFSTMRWAILTPDEMVYWNQENLFFDKGVPRHKAPQADEMEDLWKVFYKNIFNPARIKVKMMKSEMPKKYWHTMPETELISEMLEDSPKNVAKMFENMKPKK